jgi:hypothetical protein
MQRFYAEEIPVASSMIEAVRCLPPHCSNLIQHFMCYWIAFNNIYVTIADRNSQAGKGVQRVTPSLKPDGTQKIKREGGADVPQVSLMSERDQIAGARKEFSPELKHKLIVHANTEFFVRRIPKWRGRRIPKDKLGQCINGVLNIGKTIDEKHPIWAPIDTAEYNQYVKNCADGLQADANLQERLASQILEVLYTVRNNTFHGGKRADDASDREVLRNALPLLTMIVYSFVKDIPE